MPRTYTENTGITKPGDGEESGVWGGIVNDNMDILDRAINGVLSLSLSGTTTTLTTGSGSTSGTGTYGQYRVLVLGGSPSGTNTITVAPNDAQKLYFVVNNSGESVVFTQGSGGNVTISDGDSAIIYCDGAGAGAAVTDVSALFVPDLANAGVTASVADLNVLDGITSSTAELNILTGVTSNAAELNILDGVTATTAELNYLDVTTLGTSEASKAVTTDANGVTIFDGGVVEDATTITSTGGAATINCRDGNVFSHTLTENVTYTFSNAPASGRAFGFTLKVVQDSTARTITWPASVDWAGGEAPTLSTGSGDVDVFVFFTHDGGTTWYGFTAGQVMS